MRSALVLIGILFSYLLLWPVDADAVSWSPKKAPQMIGKYEPNELLKKVEILGLNDGIGPEDIAIDDAGNLYAGYEDGRIMKYDASGNKLGLFADTQGRPLGMDFDEEGSLVIADIEKGLLRADQSGSLTTLAIEAEGVPFRLTDDVDVAPNGKIYFTDASSRYSDFRLDLLAHQAYGRLLEHDPATGETRVLSSNLHFANGVAVSPKGDFLLVNETAEYRIHKYWLKGERAGRMEVLMDNLPGFPDGISSNGSGTYWIAMASLRKKIVDDFADKPFVRKILLRFPEALQPAPDRHAFVLGIDGEGRVMHNFQDPSPDSFSPITSVEEREGLLYLGSLTYPGFARISSPD